MHRSHKLRKNFIYIHTWKKYIWLSTKEADWKNRSDYFLKIWRSEAIHDFCTAIPCICLFPVAHISYTVKYNYWRHFQDSRFWSIVCKSVSSFAYILNERNTYLKVYIAIIYSTQKIVLNWNPKLHKSLIHIFTLQNHIGLNTTEDEWKNWSDNFIEFVYWRQL